MKHLLIASLLLMTIGFSQTSYAAGSCNLIKNLYDSGKYKRAFKLVKTYSNYKDACADYYLALMYLDGKGTKASGEKGDFFMQRAAKNGYQPAIDFLATVLP